MVVRGVFLFITFWLPFQLFSQDVTVTAQMESEGVVNTALEGTITVTHNQNQPVDIESFRLDEKQIGVELVRQVQLSQFSDLVLSIYRFTLEPKEAGLHELPMVTVTVGNRTFRSVPTTYTVQDPIRANGAPSSKSERQLEPKPQPQPTKARTTIILNLENIIEGNTTLYPGQRLVVGYRFLYNFSFDLKKEQLPLLEATGFQKIGGTLTKEFKIEQLNHLEARQMIEAIKAGDYHFPAGEIVGRAYQMNRFGQKQTAPVDSTAKSKPVTLRVIPFPLQDQPSSFNGAIGQSFDFQVDLLSSDVLAVGDKMTLRIKISGSGQLETIPAPEVCCQPGFSGYFRVSDLPAVEKVTGTQKTFQIEMRPISDTLTEIPSLRFSYFNPETKSYTTLKSQPIPITLKPLKTQQMQKEKPPKQETSAQEQPENAAARPIEIRGNLRLSPQDLKPKRFGTWWTLLIIPFGVAMIFLQWQTKRFIEKQQAIVKQKNSQQIFEEAMDQPHKSSHFFYQIQHAFLLRLVERGEIDSETLAPYELKKEGPAGKVRALLREVDEKRFAGKKKELTPLFIEKIKSVFDEIAPK